MAKKRFESSARGKPPELCQKLRADSYGNQLLCVPALRPPHAAGSLQLFIRGFRYIRKVNLPVGGMLFALCGSLAAR